MSTDHIAVFPVMPPLDAVGNSAAGYSYPEQGMTLRDYFAIRLMTALILKDARPADSRDCREAYHLADMMIEVRKEPNP